MHFTTLPVLIICFCRAFKLRKLRARKIAHAKGWFRICLNIFLNSQFNASSAPSDRSSDHSDECIGYSEVGSNEGSTSKLVLFMEYSSFIYVYERHLWIMRSMSLAYSRRWLRWPETKDRCFRIGFRLRFFTEIVNNQAEHREDTIRVATLSFKFKLRAPKFIWAHAPRWKALLCQIVPA